MSLISIINVLSKKPFHNKAALAEAVAAQLLKECPGVAALNTSSIRSAIFDLLDYNGSGPQHVPCTGSSVTIPFEEGTITLTATEKKVSKVCPSCKLTANVGDPICPGCNHIYSNHVLEERVVAASIAALLPTKITGSKYDTVLDDTVEGFKVTERDVDKYMRGIEKYIPLR